MLTFETSRHRRNNGSEDRQVSYARLKHVKITYYVFDHNIGSVHTIICLYRVSFCSDSYCYSYLGERAIARDCLDVVMADAA